MNALETVASGHPSPRILSREEADEYVVTIDVSGFADDELAVEVNGRQLVVHGDRSEPADLPFAVHEQLQESFRLPDDADSDRVNAFFRPGALEIHARRKSTGHRVPIERGDAGDVPKGC